MQYNPEPTKYFDQLNAAILKIDNSIAATLSSLTVDHIPKTHNEDPAVEYISPDPSNCSFSTFNITLHATNIIESTENLLSLIQTLQQAALLNNQVAMNEDIQESNENYKQQAEDTKENYIDECCDEMENLLRELEEEYYSSNYI